jgi:hypothetical protein
MRAPAIGAWMIGNSLPRFISAVSLDPFPPPARIRLLLSSA